nr:hypothetical protein [Streptomyces sp. TLI_235]
MTLPGRLGLSARALDRSATGPYRRPGKCPDAYAEFARVVRTGGLVLAAFQAGEEIRHRDSWFDRPVSLDFFALRPDEVAAGLSAAGFKVEASLMRGPYSDEADTERAYLLARRL